MEGKDLGNGESGLLSDLGIGIDEGKAESFGQFFSDGRFSGPHQSDQTDAGGDVFHWIKEKRR